ncbi:MAG: hypothetical protein M3Q22_02340, partial [Actinomycetota bacterium]|nr:hypothetical protein [Actinomycetota bacterium]
MYRDVTVYRLVAGGSDERLRTLMADNSALHAEIPGLVSYSLTRSDPSRDPDYVVRMAVSADDATLDACFRHPLMKQLDQELAQMATAKEQIRTQVDPDSEWYRAMVPDVWSDLDDVVRAEYTALM